MSRTLFEKYGGFKSISRIVLTFYEMVLDSERIGDHFENVDMARLIDHQTKFIASLMGGPASFSDERLEQVHRHLGIDDGDFDEVEALLAEALEEHGVSAEDIRVIGAVIETKRSLIVARRAA
ncbi:group I truncated hemoglobin [Albibacillus kandeliae]|uniref:group I truncated hemoglobin n=1 Tax=Albibacillus kandeliae TaxID=2174228 RepID=UPI000D69EA0E|nr:group 1 truncated hemoglobin [Albibacillus kandeliae]